MEREALKLLEEATRSCNNIDEQRALDALMREAQPAQEQWNEDEWRRNNWRCGHGWLRGEQCEICNAAQPAQEPKYWNVIDPAGNIVASETDAIRGWARIAGSYKPTVEGLLGLHEQGWRVLPKVTPPLPVQPAQEPVAFDAFIESQDFYELMQTYRHCPIDAHVQFEEVKDALRAAHIGAKP